ncbi:MAG: nuclear transport factor 2 family protein [bacterium]
MVQTREWIGRLFHSIDNRRLDDFLSFLSDDVVFRFGNADPARGKDAVATAVGGFFDSIKGLRHDVIQTMVQGDAVVCHGVVTYTRHDETTLTVPFANVFNLAGERVREYYIFIDVSELYNPAPPA